MGLTYDDVKKAVEEYKETIECVGFMQVIRLDIHEYCSNCVHAKDCVILNDEHAWQYFRNHRPDRDSYREIVKPSRYYSCDLWRLDENK